jgi:hypothetical protein
MALEGTLRDFSLADIFQLIGLQRKTGVLSLRSPEDVVTVSFVDGKVVGADSVNKRLEDRLGQVLIRTRLVTAQQLDGALQEQMETLERMGRILIRRQVLSLEQLRSALQQQVLQIIFRVFRWEDGDYHFSQETSVDYDAELMMPITAESVLMEGARMLDEWPLIERRIPNRGIVFVRSVALNRLEVTQPEEDDFAELELAFDQPQPAPAPPPPASGAIAVSPVEARVLQLVNGARSVDEIVQESPHGDFDTCKALYSALNRGLIREASPTEMARALAQAARGGGSSEQRPGVPWAFFILVPALVAAVLVAPRNPLNPIVGPRPGVHERVQVAASRARMAGIWGVLNANAFLVGSYPESLGELTRAGSLAPDALKDPWGRPYRYILREDSVLLAGFAPQGAPDSRLLFTHAFPAATEPTASGPGVSVLP